MLAYVALRDGGNRETQVKPPTLDRRPLPCHMPIPGSNAVRSGDKRVFNHCAIQALIKECIVLCIDLDYKCMSDFILQAIDYQLERVSCLC